MLDQIFTQQFTTAIDISAVLISLLAALAMGGVMAIAYNITHKGVYTKSGFSVTLTVVPAVITLIIMLIGDNVARAFSIAGAFSIIRFRSIAGEPLDMAYTFSALGIGLGCGMGYFGFSAVFTVLLSSILVIAHFAGRIKSKKLRMILKISVPENLNFSDAFDDILEEFTEEYSLMRVKTAEFGTVFEITYHIVVMEDTDQKEFIDRLRCLNGNLNISLNIGEAAASYE